MLDPAIWKKVLDGSSSQVPFNFVAGIHHTVPDKFYCPPHFHPAVEIVYHPSGSGQTRFGHQQLAFAEGSAVVYAPKESHDQTMTSDGEDLCVQIALPRRLANNLKGGFHVSQIKPPWLIEEIQHLCRSPIQPGGLEQRVFDLRATAVLLALVDIATTVSQEDALPLAERHVLQAEQFISEHFSSLHSLPEVARHVGISHDHLRHIFKQVRGRSLINHLNEVKVGRAKVLLTRSPFPLKQIATMCGFRDEYYFSAVFRRLTNLPPGTYRQKTAARI